MDVKTIQDKKKVIEEKVRQVEETKRKALKIVQDSVAELLKLTGAYSQLIEIEKELSNPLEKKEI